MTADATYVVYRNGNFVATPVPEDLSEALVRALWSDRRGRARSLAGADGGPRAMRYAARGFGGERRDPEQVKREGWKDQGVLAVAVNDDRLTWPERA